MDSTQSRAASLAERLAASMSSSSDSKENSSSFSSSSFGGSTGSAFGESPFGSASNGMTSIDNPFYIGNLSSSDQDKLRSAFSNAF